MNASFKITYLLVYIAILFTAHSKAGTCIEGIKKDKPVSITLEEHLFCDYDKTVRPVKTKNVTNVEVMLIVHAFDYSELSLELSVASWIAMRWNDAHLTWELSEFDNISHIHIESGKIWTPDISMYNQPQLYGGNRIFDEKDDCIISHKGEVVCVAGKTLEGLCVPDLKHWPFDVQNCTIRLGSWLHHGEEIDINATYAKVELVEYYNHTEWNLYGTDVQRDPGIFKCCPNNTYPSLHYHFIMHRHSAVIAATVVLPCIIMMIISILALWSDPKSSDRVYLITLIIPCHIIFLHTLNWILSANADTIPYIVQYLRDSLLMVTLILIETLVVRSMLATKRMSPVWLVATCSIIINSKAGQLLLISELNPEGAATQITGDDSSILVDNKLKQRPKEWYLLGVVIDKVLFGIYIFTYLIMIIIFIPK